MNGIDAAVEIQAFTAERVRALTGLSLRQLRYWDEQGFIKPGLTVRTGRGGKRLYSFRDLVSLRVASQLRGCGISLQQIRRVNSHLQELDYRQPLAELRFLVLDGRLYFEESRTCQEGRRPEQVIADYVVPVAEIANDLAAQVATLRQRQTGQIERRRGALGGKLLIGGTRITVAALKRLAADGASEAEILEMYPDLTPDDIRAALATETVERRNRAG
jgi:uncharacterized protein (DUF433 family)